MLTLLHSWTHQRPCLCASSLSCSRVFGVYGERTGSCLGNSPAVIPRWRTYFLQLNFHDAEFDAAVCQHPYTARSTFAHEGDFTFTWGFYRNFDLTILVPSFASSFQTMTIAMHRASPIIIRPAIYSG